MDNETTTGEGIVTKWCSICHRKGHYASEHEDWEKL